MSQKLKREMPLHLMLVPGIIVTLIFGYIPMFGSIMAFQEYIPAMGMLKSKWVGLDNFKFILNLPDISLITWNTLYIATLKIVCNTLLAILLAILLDDLTQKIFKRSVQTLIYLPYFLSWVILGGVLRDILSLHGVVNQVLENFGIQPIMFLADNKIFPWVLIISNSWQTVGFGTIVYLAAITNINPSLYESAVVDGAGRFKQTLYITLPGMKPIIVLMITLSLGSILNAGFDQIFVLYSPAVYQSSDIIDTWVYRAGLQEAQYSIATAVGLFKSVVSCILISVSYFLAHRFANYRIF